jgi:hypothetical protein
LGGAFTLELPAQRRSFIFVVGPRNKLAMKVLFVLIVLSLAVCAEAQGSNFDALHCTRNLSRFASTNEIVAFFQSNSMSFKPVPLKQHADHYFWVVSYPYSGLDTIDVYCFRHGDAGVWTVTMLYFVLSPKYRDVNVVEEPTRFVVRNGSTELLTFGIHPEAEK